MFRKLLFWLAPINYSYQSILHILFLHGLFFSLFDEQVQKQLMLERFGEENPGFDFSGADFSGSVPDPRNFMGGVKYQ